MTRRATGSTHGGFSLIELLVSMLIGVVVALAIAGALIRSDASRLDIGAARDAAQTGSRAVFAVDRAIRNAGSGFAQNWRSVFGCRLDVSRDGTQVLPVTLGAASPFARLNGGALLARLAPVVIGKGLADTRTETRGDVLMVMSGTSGMSELARPVDSIAGDLLTLPNTLGYRVGDLILLSSDSVTSGCMVQQIGDVARSAGGMTLAGTYFHAKGSDIDLSAFADRSIALQLGSDRNPPQFHWYGVGRKNSLVRYDLLKKAADGPELAIAEGVMELRALYGVDAGTSREHVSEVWVDPSGEEFGADVLISGSASAKLSLRRIVAIKVGFIFRASARDRDDKSAETAVTLFSDVRSADGESLAYTRKFSGADLGYRYRTVEVTIPLRNVLMADPP